MRSASPEALVPTARELLAAHTQARDVALLLADYGLTELRPVTTPPHTGRVISVHDGAPVARAFATEAPTLEAGVPGTVTLHLSVTVRGDRVGVLSVNLPKSSLGMAAVMELRAFAATIGRKLVIADRHTDLYLRARRRQRLTLAAEMQELEAQLPLGMFEDTDYREQPLSVAPSDRLVIVTAPRRAPQRREAADRARTRCVP
ncbi:hypothetical protein ACIPWY_31490 [Streptomyces sp. NPDC090032]|uniref:hypothetical protein n=1 Tax=Streptomyces sp. NPDC090032 TaxID=3365925 RepID=UPI00380E78E7